MTFVDDIQILCDWNMPQTPRHCVVWSFNSLAFNKNACCCNHKADNKTVCTQYCSVKTYPVHRYCSAKAYPVIHAAHTQTPLCSAKRLHVHVTCHSLQPDNHCFQAETTPTSYHCQANSTFTKLSDSDCTHKILHRNRIHPKLVITQTHLVGVKNQTLSYNGYTHQAVRQTTFIQDGVGVWVSSETQGMHGHSMTRSLCTVRNLSLIHI